MWQISHIQNICYFLHLLFGGLLEKKLILAQNENIDKRVHMGSRSKVKSGSNVPPIINLGVVSVFPKKILRRFLSPKHQINLHLLYQRQTNILCNSQSLFVFYTVLVYDHEMSEGSSFIMQSVKHLLVNFIENWTIFSQIVSNCIVDIWHFWYVELLCFSIEEFLS